MKIITTFVTLALLGGVSGFGYTLHPNTFTAVTDGSDRDVIAALADGLVSDGWVLTLPSGRFVWSKSVSIHGKAVTLRGAGGGRARGSSVTSHVIGTGEKSFLTQSGLGFQAGEGIRVHYKANQAGLYMAGTVVSYSGSNLVINVAQAVGAGAYAAWSFQQDGLTIVTNAAGTNILIALTESTNGSVRLEGVHFVQDSATGRLVRMSGGKGWHPIVIKGCRFDVRGNVRLIETYSPHGVIASCDFRHLDAWTGAAVSTQTLGMPSVSQASWGQRSTMGQDDIGGTNNFYVEDCWFLGFPQQCVDMDGGARFVMRYCYLDNSGLTSHGMDSGVHGLRHFELYNNTFIFNNLGTNTCPISYWLYLRGGTGVIYSNVIPNMISTQYGDKKELLFTVMNLQFNGGPYACWGANQPGTQYPAPRQVGMGYVSGTGAYHPEFGYLGDREPLYIWGNSGGYAVAIANYGGTACANPDSSVDYISPGRDYFNDGTAKPGWRPYIYPHPLRSALDSGTGRPIGPGSLHVVEPN